MNLSKHFTLEEMIHSQTASRLGLDNTPTKVALEALKFTAENMELVRELFGHPIVISSGYRSLAVNKAVGGAATSQHTRGEAVDFLCPGFGVPANLMKILTKSTIKYDQCILEYPLAANGGWIHISFNKTPRRQNLVVDKSGTRAYV
jgi:zinc D-Ala-D-Ala carboxypeptidase